MKNAKFTSLGKALDILSLFTSSRRELTSREISTLLGIPISSTYKYVELLVSRDFLAQKEGSSKLSLGLMMFRLSNAFLADFELPSLAEPAMRKLSQETEETVLLTAVQGDSSICLSQLEPERLVKVGLHKSYPLPLHAGATSRALLAFQRDEFIEEYLAEKEEDNTQDRFPIRSKEKLKELLAESREIGYAYSTSEVDSGVFAVSMPVFNSRGQVEAALGVAAPVERVNARVKKKIIEKAKAAAAEISKELGYSEEEEA